MTRTVGTSDQVIEAFIAGRHLRTAAASVPGGCRVTSGGVVLFSYRTAVAWRREDGVVEITTRKYSVTTSRMLRALESTLRGAGYRPVAVVAGTNAAAVPGRWGGFGPAWHATGYETPAVTEWRYMDRPERDAWDDAVWAAQRADDERRFAKREAREARRRMSGVVGAEPERMAL